MRAFFIFDVIKRLIMGLQNFKAQGRPRIWEDSEVEKLQDEIDKFFEFCEKEKTVATVTGLALWLGFECRRSLTNYKNKPVFFSPIKRALTRIEMYHEAQAATRDKPTGNIFILKNFGWDDVNTIIEDDENQNTDENNDEKVEFI